MKEIVILSGKGGAGKTTIAASFNVIAENNVAVDADVEAANLKFLLRLQDDVRTKAFFGMKRAKIDPDICTDCGACEEICQFGSIYHDETNYDNPVMQVNTNACEGGATCTHVCPVDAITMVDHKAGETYQSTTEYERMLFHANLHLGEENTGMLVAEVRRQAKTYADKLDKDWIIVDGPPGTGCPVTSATTGANFVVLAIESSLSGLSDFTRILDLVVNFWLPRAVIINKYDLNEKVTSQIENICKERRVPILGKLPYDTAIQVALANQSPVVLSDPDSESSCILRNVWDKLVEVIDKDQKEEFEMDLGMIDRV